MAGTGAPVSGPPDADRHGVVGAVPGVADSLGLHRTFGAAYPTLALPDRDESVVVVGRSRGCDVIPGDLSVSRTHAAVMLFAGQWFVTDRGSTKGTFVNGRQVWGATVVRPGDRVSFGNVTYVLASPA
jgi:hypothetical protein